MPYINWERTFPVDPVTGEVLPIGTEGALELPTYGNYGGGGYSAGEFGGQLLATSSGGRSVDPVLRNIPFTPSS